MASELHILYLQDIQVATSGRVPSSPTIRNEKPPHRRHIGVDHSCRIRVHYLPFWDSLPSLAEWILKGFVTIVLIVWHHLGWQHILRPFPRNREESSRFAPRNHSPQKQQAAIGQTIEPVRWQHFFILSIKDPRKESFSCHHISCTGLSGEPQSFGRLFSAWSPSRQSPSRYSQP